MIQHGSSKGNLQKIALEIFGICMNHAIRLGVEWIPQEWNKQADYLSNVIDKGLGPRVKTVSDSFK